MLFAGALLFLFPFYYMLIGSLQAEPNTGLSGLLPNPGNLTLHNYEQIDGAISLGRTLVNSGVFTGGVLLGTVVFGLLAGYALAVLEFRGKGAVFASVLLILVVPFQLLTVPLYVLIVRDYGLADSYLGMILPFAINSTAVFVFRQFFLQLPKELFEAARIDGAGELSILLADRDPAVQAGVDHRGAADLHRPVERVPLALPRDQGAIDAAARGVAGQLHQHRLRARGEPVRRDPGRRVRARRARGGAVHRLPEEVRVDADRLGGEGMTVATFPFALTRAGLVMSPLDGDELEAEGVLNPASGRTPDGTLYLLPRLVAAGNVSRVGLATVVAGGRGAGRRGAPRCRARSPTRAGSGARAMPASRTRASRGYPGSGCT